MVGSSGLCGVVGLHHADPQRGLLGSTDPAWLRNPVPCVLSALEQC